MNANRRADHVAGRDGSTEGLNLAALARVKESKLVRLKAAGYARDATVPLCAARIAVTTASKGSKGVMPMFTLFRRFMPMPTRLGRAYAYAYAYARRERRDVRTTPKDCQGKWIH